MSGPTEVGPDTAVMFPAHEARSGMERTGMRVPMRGPDEVEVRVSVNGVEYAVRIEPRVSLLDLVRERLDLTGTKRGATRAPVARAPSGSAAGGCFPA